MCQLRRIAENCASFRHNAAAADAGSTGTFEGAALPEGSGGDDAVDKVAKEVAGEDVRDQRPLDQRQAPNLVQVRGDHRLDGEDRERSVWILGLVGAFRDVLERMGA
eukprot:3651034-Rhodomonas_salina.3